MAEKSGFIKKETLIFGLLIGFIAGFISGAIFAVYKLTPSTQSPPGAASKAPSQPIEGGTPNMDPSSKLNPQQVQAIATLEAEVSANPKNGEAWTRLGHLYFDTDQPKKAIKAYTQSLQLQPDNPDVWTDLGVMYRRNKQPDKAIESFEKAYAIQPDHAPSRLNKGIVLLYDFNKPIEAVGAWEELLAINPEAKLNDNMDLKKAIEELKKNIAEHEPKKEQVSK